MKYWIFENFWKLGGAIKWRGQLNEEYILHLIAPPPVSEIFQKIGRGAIKWSIAISNT